MCISKGFLTLLRSIKFLLRNRELEPPAPSRLQAWFSWMQDAKNEERRRGNDQWYLWEGSLPQAEAKAKIICQNELLCQIALSASSTVVISVAKQNHSCSFLRDGDSKTGFTAGFKAEWGKKRERETAGLDWERRGGISNYVGLPLPDAWDSGKNPGILVHIVLQYEMTVYTNLQL